jgi:hypothetical protein
MRPVAHHLLDNRQQVIGADRPREIQGRPRSSGHDDAVGPNDAIVIMNRSGAVRDHPRSNRRLPGWTGEHMDSSVTR